MKRLLRLILFLIPLTGFSQNREFRQFTADEGLSNNAVLCLYQDEYGMIWAGTRNGLNRYNGNVFRVCKYRKGDPNCIQNNYIKELTGDRNGKLYAIAFGITELDLESGVFKVIKEEETSAICWHGALYAGVGRKVLRYDGSRFEEICEVPAEALGITSIGVDDDCIFIGTEARGLYKYDMLSAPVNVIRNDKISSIYHDRNGRWWIGSWHSGMYIIDGQGIRNIRHDSSSANSLSSDFVRCFCQDGNGDIWIGTFNGINIYNPEKGTFTWLYDSNAAAGYTSVWSLICDRQGNVWAGSYFDGMYMYPENSGVFKYWKRTDDITEGLSSNMVREFAEDRYGNLWIATDGGGLGMLDRSREKFSWYRHNASGNSLSHDNVTSLYYDGTSDTLWIGTHLGGLNSLDIRTRQFGRLHARGRDSCFISDVIKDVEKLGNRLIVATDKGICLLDPETEKAQEIFADRPDWATDIRGCMVDSEGKVWIYGGGLGVMVWDPGTEGMKRYVNDPENPNSLCSNSINAVFQDSRSRIWLCSNKDGIDMYDPSTDSFSNLDESHNSLISNCVYNAAELPSGRLIFTTDSGFSILNDSTGTFINYDRSNGLQLSTINETALKVTSGKEIFIGADNGMVSFVEDALDSAPPGYSISPFRLTVLGVEIHAGGKDGILEKPLMQTDRLVLKSSQGMFSIEYVTSDYLSDDEKNLEYFMEGLSKEWTVMEGMPVVTFTHLNKGKYRLTVRPRNNRSSEYASVLDITVLPPAWQSWWAVMLYIISGGIFSYLLMRNWKNHVQLKEALKYEKSRAKDIESLNRSKIRFFTNISHEFRTPLTLIIGNTEMLMQVNGFPPEIYNKILAIFRNSTQMRELVTELLDFSKLGTGHMKIKVSAQNIVKFAYETFLLFKEYADNRRIAFSFVKTEENITVWFDSRQMQKVLNNLLSNAFKHVKDGGKISVVIRRDGPYAVIEVNDNGCGIPPQDIPRIFDRFYQNEYQETDTYTGTGIGLFLTKGIIELHHGHIEVYSLPGEGASFKVFLQTGSSHFSAEELDGGKTSDTAVLPVEESPAPTVDLPEKMTGKTPEHTEMPKSDMNCGPSSGSGGKCRKYRMLIAEDNGDLRELLVKIFEASYTVEAVADGEKAWEAVQERQPDIVLADIIMPGLSGTELCRKIKTDISTCHIPVVMLTARTTVRQNLEGLYAGADDYISKPFNVNILMARCNNIINNRTMLKDKFSREVQATPQMLTTNPLDRKLMEKIDKVINEHIDDTGLNAETLISEIGISRTKLFSKIKSITGMTPANFILTVRLKRAAEMLEYGTDLNISEIADKLGFASPRQFSRFFKEKYGIIPKLYRQNRHDRDSRRKNETNDMTDGI